MEKEMQLGCKNGNKRMERTLCDTYNKVKVHGLSTTRNTTFKSVIQFTKI